MGLLEIKRVPLVLIERAPELPDLLAEYAAESANDQIGPVCPHMPTYRLMENGGGFYTFGAFLDGRLIGFLFLMMPLLPHYSLKVAVSESFFVASKHRKTGAGTLLRQVAEDFATTGGAVGIMFSAPIGGALEKVLPKAGYADKARVFFKALK